MGVNGGYVYTWVIKNLYITGALSVGVNVGSDNVKFDNGIKFFPTLLLKFSAGYTYNSWSLNLTYINNRTYLSFTDNLSNFIDAGKIQFSFVKWVDFKNKKNKSN